MCIHTGASFSAARKFSQITVHDAPPYTHTQEGRATAAAAAAAGDNVYTKSSISLLALAAKEKINTGPRRPSISLFRRTHTRRERVSRNCGRKRIIWKKKKGTPTADHFRSWGCVQEEEI